ncbi:uncharacterized protein LOC129745622 isoform X4 [Uranotaenia lowii]|nr:uncharacterized protein LOC129745622 isoform X4 [Uranotaenia lowii]
MYLSVGLCTGLMLSQGGKPATTFGRKPESCKHHEWIKSRDFCKNKIGNKMRHDTFTGSSPTRSVQTSSALLHQGK